MRRRSGEVLVIGEERLDEGVLPFDDGGERNDPEPRPAEPATAGDVAAGVAARVKRIAPQRRQWQAALGGAAVLALGGAWLAAGLGSPEPPSSLASDPVRAVPVVGERHEAGRIAAPDPERAQATRPGQRSGGGAAREGGAPPHQAAEASAPSPTGPAPTTAPPSPPTAAAPTETQGPPPAAPTPASPGTVQREFGP